MAPAAFLGSAPRHQQTLSWDRVQWGPTGSLRHRVAQGWGQHPGLEYIYASIPLAAACWAPCRAMPIALSRIGPRTGWMCPGGRTLLGSSGRVGLVPRVGDPGGVAALNPGLVPHPCGATSSAASPSGCPNPVLLRGKRRGLSRTPAPQNPSPPHSALGAAPASPGGGSLILLLRVASRLCLGHLFAFPSANPAAEMLLLGPNPAEPNPTPPHSSLGCC